MPWSCIPLFLMYVCSVQEKNVSVIVRLGYVNCVECYLFVRYVVGFVCLGRYVASGEC
jgi:hypothetical protein